MASFPRTGRRRSQPWRPDACWHIAGLAKCIGAGLRLAYVIAPDARAAWSFNSAMRALCVMASPVCAAVATRWIEDGAADTMLRFIPRREHRARADRGAEAGAPEPICPIRFRSTYGCRCAMVGRVSAFVNHVRGTGLGVVPSDAFTTAGAPAEAVRVGLGGPVTRSQVERGLEFMAHRAREPSRDAVAT